MIMEDSPAALSVPPFSRTSPTKRSFDVAFLTGVRDDPPPSSHSPIQQSLTYPPPSPPSSTPLHLSPSCLYNHNSSSNSSNTTLHQSTSSSPDEGVTRIPLPSSFTPPTLPKQPRVSEPSPRIESPAAVDPVPTSAFTKVTRSVESSTPRPVSEAAPALPSTAGWASSTASLNAVTSFLNGNKSLAPLLATSGIFNPSLSPLFTPDRVNNNFVEEYLKSQQNIMAGKSAVDCPMSPTEALSRLRSSMYPSDPYKMSFGSLGYPMSGQSTQAPPKMNSVPFIPPNPVSALIPSALTTLSLASQNVCAKCNISFRMTSDLVYHMRSQHKREQDPYKKRRNDRLKCTICGESFRERHHLTRHMTAHQDRSDEREAK